MDDELALAQLDDAILHLRQTVDRARAAVAKVRRDRGVIERGRNDSREFGSAGSRPPIHVRRES